MKYRLYHFDSYDYFDVFGHFQSGRITFKLKEGQNLMFKMVIKDTNTGKKYTQFSPFKTIEADWNHDGDVYSQRGARFLPEQSNDPYDAIYIPMDYIGETSSYDYEIIDYIIGDFPQQ